MEFMGIQFDWNTLAHLIFSALAGYFAGKKGSGN
jgi:hypothetical protein